MVIWLTILDPNSWLQFCYCVLFHMHKFYHPLHVLFSYVIRHKKLVIAQTTHQIRILFVPNLISRGPLFSFLTSLAICYACKYSIMLYSGRPHTIYDVLHSTTYSIFWSLMCKSRLNNSSLLTALWRVQYRVFKP